ncbi:MAG TPA: hypothetical protein VE891_08105 [Allosphingosinicella sp.]|nr:hypothetical protein [Allosphingosinicella sp.]
MSNADRGLFDCYRVRGPSPPLAGSIVLPGAKNSAMPILVAACLAPSPVAVEGLPDIADLRRLKDLLASLGISIRAAQSSVVVDGRTLQGNSIPNSQSSAFRGSIYGLIPPAVRFGHGRIGAIGGDRIVGRTLEPHQRAYRGFGLSLEAVGESWVVTGGPPRPAQFELNENGMTASSTALMLAAACAGRSVISGVSTELEVLDVEEALRQLGCDVRRDGRTVVVQGPIRAPGTPLKVPPDVITFGTFAAATAITGGATDLLNVGDPRRLAPVSTALEAIGIRLKKRGDSIHVAGRPRRCGNIRTGMFPDFPADLQPIFTCLFCLAPGDSIVTEGVYAARFDHVAPLNRLGARIRRRSRRLHIAGVPHLAGAQVGAAGIRESASLLLAALAARGETRLREVGDMHRGYENLPRDLVSLGAPIEEELPDDCI